MGLKPEQGGSEDGEEALSAGGDRWEAAAGRGSAIPGSVEHDMWQTINAFEIMLTEERGKTTRLSRTRQKIARVGVVQTLIDWALATNETEGFRMLLERGMPEMTGEAIVLRHPSVFGDDVIEAARDRLRRADVEQPG